MDGTGTIRECSAETPKMQLSALMQPCRQVDLLEEIWRYLFSYATADIEMLESKVGTVRLQVLQHRTVVCRHTHHILSNGIRPPEDMDSTPAEDSHKLLGYLNGGTYFYSRKTECI